MNDPHVVALIYKIEHGPSVDYSKAEPLDRKETNFRVQITNEEVRFFEFKKHYATAAEARQAIEVQDYIRAWEVDAGLRRGPDYFKLKYDRAQREDRNPTTGAVDIETPIRFIFTLSEPTVTLSTPCYPPPPSGLLITSDVQIMYGRYMSSRHSELLTVANFCLDMLEFSAKKKPNEKKKQTDRRRAAEMYGIEWEVLDKIGLLAGTKGGPQQSRKVIGKNNKLEDQDRCFLNKAIKAVIRRAAEKAHGSDSDLPEISLQELLCP